MIYLVKARIDRIHYMETSPQHYADDDIRLVEAETASKAQEIYEKYWSDQCSEYSRRYIVFNLEVVETLR